jgi:ComF family protein
MLKTLLNLIIPNRCICSKILVDGNSDICPECWGQIGLISTKSVCECCGNPFEYEAMSATKCAECISSEPYFDKARAVFKYNDVNGKMITGLKYSDKTPYTKTLAKFILQKLGEIGDEFDLIVSVPIHRKKLRQRKFNQSALLARKLGRIANKPSNNLLLRKIKDVPPQASLNRRQRIDNVKGSIAIDTRYKNLVRGKKLLLVDDVITTGATASECARILKKSGAEKVYLVTAARTMLENQ